MKSLSGQWTIPAANEKWYNLTMAKILVVDDNPDLRAMYKIALEKQGQEAVVLPSADENFVETVLSIAPNLISLDLFMPGIGGYEALRLLKADRRTSEIPVFLLSNRGEIEDITKGMDLGAADYLIAAQHNPEEVVRCFTSYLDNPKMYETHYLHESYYR